MDSCIYIYSSTVPGRFASCLRPIECIYIYPGSDKEIET